MKISSVGWIFVLTLIYVTIVSSAPAPKPAPTPGPKPKPAPEPAPKPKPAPAPKPAPEPAPKPKPAPTPKPAPAPAPAPGGEVEDETEFSYEKKGKKGPAKWGTIKEEWKMCGTGKMQSPIDLRDKNVVVTTKLGSLRSQYLPSNTTIKNRGHDIMLKFKGGNKGIGITVNGTKYQLQQLHWHSPSEHTINGKRYALEKHLVHESKDKRYAVVAFLYKLGASDPFLLSLDKQLKKITDTHEAEEHVGIIDPKKLSFKSKLYYRYIGSLTAPPCSENVIWSVAKEIRTVTSKQVKLLRVAVHDDSNSNARPLQPINKRVVYLYKPKA
ncbi:PREDICTED: alpha carbonic anhydrase 8 [Camelina sativa]|uniref:Alpha carbonic anhydrase 8 n=1 Tax=Camelina sativa TaxID=90675 RepID=A0ABM0V5B6_CAMSA|nr:PREDICTED: alpha carbonic anhydrase 8 [Camelina sativa]